MSWDRAIWAEVDEQGRLVLPAQVANRYGLRPGARLRIDEDTNNFRLHRPTGHLAKVYVEPTNRCNITCRTCIRNSWAEPMGMMSQATFARLVEGVEAISPKPLVFFGGLGEPLFHPRIVEMVARVKATGAQVELITNGTLITEALSRKLVATGLDTLWISIDGATPESYADVRLGAQLPQVLENIRRLRSLRKGFYYPQPTIGIAFVAMKRNIGDLAQVVAIGRSLGAARFMVTNVIPYTPEMRGEILYERAMKDKAYFSSVWVASLSLPKMDIDDTTRQAFLGALRSGCSITFAGNRWSGANDACIFVEAGATAVGWDGSVSPCPPLLHTHTTYLRARQRTVRRHVIGNVNDRELTELWTDPAYLAYRERVQGFAFPPCTFCGGCDQVEGNQEDCLGNSFPVCGACLWAQGLIQCP